MAIEEHLTDLVIDLILQDENRIVSNALTNLIFHAVVLMPILRSHLMLLSGYFQKAYWEFLENLRLQVEVLVLGGQLTVIEPLHVISLGL